MANFMFYVLIEEEHFRHAIDDAKIFKILDFKYFILYIFIFNFYQNCHILGIQIVTFGANYFLLHNCSTLRGEMKKGRA